VHQGRARCGEQRGIAVACKADLAASELVFNQNGQAFGMDCGIAATSEDSGAVVEAQGAFGHVFGTKLAWAQSVYAPPNIQYRHSHRMGDTLRWWTDD
jgi:hypothetical protein